MSELVPSESHRHGFSALRAIIKDARSISAAVAFVTEAGVGRLASLLDESRWPEVEIVARAGGVTSPDALLALRKLGVEVSVVIGREASRFHPKLWLAHSAEHLSVLSGSGNLTEAGLLENDEQFELSRLPIESEEAVEQSARFERLTARAVRLDEVVDTTIWAEWKNVLIKQRLHRRELTRLEASLERREIRPNRQKDRDLLTADLMELYEQTVAERLMTKKGRHYVPTRFLQGIRRAEAGGDPIQLVYRICRHQTEGFDVILDADRPDLTVESLVVDTAKPYHDLFTDSTREISAKRLGQFQSWPGAGTPV
jgi:HKD family nuclease